MEARERVMSMAAIRAAANTGSGDGDSACDGRGKEIHNGQW